MDDSGLDIRTPFVPVSVGGIIILEVIRGDIGHGSRREKGSQEKASFTVYTHQPYAGESDQTYPV